MCKVKNNKNIQTYAYNLKFNQGFDQEVAVHKLPLDVSRAPGRGKTPETTSHRFL